MKVSIDGGPSQAVTDTPIKDLFDISPDGTTAVFAVIDHAAGHKEKALIVATDTGQTQRTVEFERPRWPFMIRFSRDGKSLVYVVRDKGVDNLWQQPLNGSAGKQLTNFTSERMGDFHWSEDGSKLAFIRGHTDSDVVLMRDQR